MTSCSRRCGATSTRPTPVWSTCTCSAFVRRSSTILSTPRSWSPCEESGTRPDRHDRPGGDLGVRPPLADQEGAPGHPLVAPLTLPARDDVHPRHLADRRDRGGRTADRSHHQWIARYQGQRIAGRILVGVHRGSEHRGAGSDGWGPLDCRCGRAGDGLAGRSGRSPRAVRDSAACLSHGWVVGQPPRARHQLRGRDKCDPGLAQHCGRATAAELAVRTDQVRQRGTLGRWNRRRRTAVDLQQRIRALLPVSLDERGADPRPGARGRSPSPVSCWCCSSLVSRGWSPARL